MDLQEIMKKIDKVIKKMKDLKATIKNSNNKSSEKIAALCVKIRNKIGRKRNQRQCESIN